MAKKITKQERSLFDAAGVTIPEVVAPVAVEPPNLADTPEVDPPKTGPGVEVPQWCLACGPDVEAVEYDEWVDAWLCALHLKIVRA